MKTLRDGEVGMVLLIVGIIIAAGIWSIVGPWFPQSPQDVAESRGITQGLLGARNQDGSFVVIFDNESLGRKQMILWPTYAKKGVDFIDDGKDYVVLVFDPSGTKDCDKLSDEELVRIYLQRVEVHY